MRLRSALSLTGAALAVALALPTATAQAAPAPTPTSGGFSPNIIGGQLISSAPWAAAVFRNGSFTCSGTIIAPTWVMTARHCVGGAMAVRVGSVFRSSGGTVANVLSAPVSPFGDIALLRLDRSINTSFSPLASSNPPVNSTNSIFGWGQTSQTAPPSQQLKGATVRVVSTNSSDAFGGQAIQSRGISGVAWRGDSGGPEFFNGLQVGVASTANSTTSQWYASVAFNRNWIRSVSGV